MFIYLSKKIAIPNGIKLRTVAWNNDQGWIACGGEEGLLKVLKLETPTTGSSGPAGAAAVGGAGVADRNGAGAGGSGAANAGGGKGTAAPSNLSMNQTLEGHNGAVAVSTWNPQHHKLTTSDDNGLIIVWILYKGIWYEEMINNRNKSIVADMQWNKDGSKICIVYQDGAVIVGSVDGNRLWGKELKINMAHVQWTPDGQRILFGTAAGELQLYDSTGAFMSKIPNYCSDEAGLIKIASMNWYNGSNGYIEPRTACLAICFENGKMQIMRDERDRSPFLIDTNMRHVNMKWNNNGSILAVSGVQFIKSAQGEEKEISVVQFFSPHGHFLRSLKVPGKRITSLSWEYSGLRIALAVDSFIYFANIRPDYRWTFFANDVLAYAYNRADRAETILTYWNTKTNERYTKPVSKLLLMTSYAENNLLITKSEDEETDQWILTVANAIGTAQETKFIDFEPKFAAMTKTHVFVASTDIVLHWQFKLVGTGKLTAVDVLRRVDARERAFHIDDVNIIGSGSSAASVTDVRKHSATADPIASITASEITLLVARQSGALHQFALPSITLDNKYTLPLRTQSIMVNCSSTRLAILDVTGVLKLFELSKGDSGALPAAAAAGAVGGMVGGKTEGGNLLNFERKDVWDFKWADDNPELFAIMEKTRMYVFRNLDPEEPITCNGYICSFDSLLIKAVLLDDIMLSPDKPGRELTVNIETKALRDTRNILSQVGLADGFQFVEEHPHPRLWKLIVDAAFEQLDFNVAKKALVKCGDYPGLQFVKTMQKLDDENKQRAEVAAYFGQYETAERIYLDMDRKDLAIELRERIGDWFRVVQLIKSGGGGDDIVLEKAWGHIGNYYYDRQKWAQAATYYAQGRNFERLAECYYLTEEYDGLEKLINTLPETSDVLRDIADKFVSVGMVEQAARAFVKAADVKSAVDACMQMNQWNMAIDLANKHSFSGIEALLNQYAAHLLASGKKLDMIELYRQANYCQNSAKLLYELAREAAKANKNPLTIKKMYVLAALEVERYHTLTRGQTASKEQTTAALDGLLVEDSKTATESKFLDEAWRGAEAYHFYILAQRQFYAGNVDGAVKTALHLREYEDLIDARVIFTLLALVSFYAKRFEACSKAFVKLESLPGASEAELEQFEKLAMNIFMKFPPQDHKSHLVPCTNCADFIRDTDTYCTHCHISFPTCIASGRPILDSLHFMCHVCKHRAIEAEISSLACCPLCHTTL
ncbi:WD repeat-containing protein 35 [Geranomyces variabilis]|nr:WD repeat-containing protein 35 [Geranomyces variabilis]